jgi:hypothetical protein
VNRPDVEVRTRSGYFAPKKEKPQKSKSPGPSALDAALANGIPTGDVPIGVSVASFARPDGGPGAEIVVVSHVQEVTGSTTASDAGTRELPDAHVVRLAATAFDQDGNSRGTFRQTVTLMREPVTSGAQYEAISRLPVKPGRYEVGVAAENGGHTGGVFAGIDVPNFQTEPLSLSGLVLGRTPDAGIAPSATVADLLPLLPTTARVFAPADRVSAFLRIYQAGKDGPSPAQVITRILNDLDKTVVEETTTLAGNRFTAQRAADHVIDLPLVRLRPGEYLLRIQVALGTRSAMREIRFTVK